MLNNERAAKTILLTLITLLVLNDRRANSRVHLVTANPARFNSPSHGTSGANGYSAGPGTRPGGRRVH